MDLILIRHGEIDSNVAKVYSGRSGEPLNGKGRVQAEQVAGKLTGRSVSALLTSPLVRAVETASILGRKLGLAPQVSHFFDELQMGPWEGLSEIEVASRYPEDFEIWNSRPADLCIAGRETLHDLSSRAVMGLFDALQRFGDVPIAIVSHVAVIRVLVLLSQGRPLNEYKSISVPNALPVSISIEPDSIRTRTVGR